MEYAAFICSAIGMYITFRFFFRYNKQFYPEDADLSFLAFGWRHLKIPILMLATGGIIILADQLLRFVP